MKKTLLIWNLLPVLAAHSQYDSSCSKIDFSGYVEIYYAYDFGKPGNGSLPAFIYSFNRHNEFNLNLGLLKAAYQGSTTRANLALATGTYIKANYATEPDVLKNIFEANAGVKISKKTELWLDAGIFASHIGFESAIGKDCWSLTRSILADNSPYYESGVKLSYTSKDGKWFLCGLLLNGWQRIRRVPGNQTHAFGHQLTYKPDGKITFNSSSFIGNDKPDSLRNMRYFHNFYCIYQISNYLAFTAGFDFGFEQKEKGKSKMNTWYSPVLIIKSTISKRSAVSVRSEYYRDAAGVILYTGTPNGFRVWGYSANFDFLITDRVTARAEARGFSGKDKIFEKNGIPSYNDYFLSTSLSISF